MHDLASTAAVTPKSVVRNSCIGHHSTSRERDVQEDPARGISIALEEELENALGIMTLSYAGRRHLRPRWVLKAP